MTGLLLSWLWSATASGFCGTYVGAAGDQLVNRQSRVVVAVSAGEVTFTMDMDVEGVTGDFGVVIPVPNTIDPDSLSVVDAAVVDVLMHATAPRGVAYTCEDEVELTRGLGCNSLGVVPAAGAVGCADYSMMKAAPYDTSATDGVAGTADPDTTTVTVEHTRAVAGYDMVLLSAEEGDDLQVWLDDAGFVLPDGAAELFDGYLGADTWFLAVTVDASNGVGDGNYLPPLQFRYPDDGSGVTIPIRLGALSAKDEQEVLIGVLWDGGQPAISNYPEAEVEADCLLAEDVDLSEHYEDSLQTAFAEVGGSGWLLEHSWQTAVKCDPCPPDMDLGPLGAAQLSALGARSDTGWGAVQTPTYARIRARYRPEAVVQDLVVYPTGRETLSQIRRIFGPPGMEALFPVCGEGFVDNPRTCPEVKDRRLGLFWGLVWPLGLLGLAVRRRR